MQSEDKPLVRRFIGDKYLRVQKQKPTYDDYGDPQLRKSIDLQLKLQAEEQEAKPESRKAKVQAMDQNVKLQDVLDKLKLISKMFYSQSFLTEENVADISDAILQARKACSSQQVEKILPPFSQQQVKTFAEKRNQYLDDLKCTVQAKEEIELVLKCLHDQKEKNRDLSIQLQERKGKIRVFCRIRPLNGSAQSCVETPKDNLNVLKIHHYSTMDNNNFSTGKSSAKPSLEYQFDGLFDEHASQQQVFQQFSPVVSLAVRGKKACIFSYGQTGSGKTHTMLGSMQNRGLAYRTLTRIYEIIAEDESEGWTYRVSLSAEEISMHGKWDLVNCRSLKLKERTSVLVDCQHSAHQFLKDTINNRKTSKTAKNVNSSRSHYILTVHVEGQRDDIKRKGVVCLTDLAGSESALTTTNIEETKFINNSLASLSSYLDYLGSNLCRNSQDSSLTIALEEYLKKETLTLMIICLSPDAEDSVESRRSANFGTKARAAVKK